MPTRKHTTHGIATTDAKVAPPYRKATAKAGWQVKRVLPQHWELSDRDIAIRYGKGQSILITHDKRAHTHNVPNGFIGYLYLDSTVRKDEEQMYIKKYTNVITKLRSTDIKGYSYYIKKTAQEDEINLL